jgi:hypothetical protein
MRFGLWLLCYCTGLVALTSPYYTLKATLARYVQLIHAAHQFSVARNGYIQSTSHCKATLHSRWDVALFSARPRFRWAMERAVESLHRCDEPRPATVPATDSAMGTGTD